MQLLCEIFISVFFEKPKFLVWITSLDFFSSIFVAREKYQNWIYIAKNFIILTKKQNKW